MRVEQGDQRMIAGSIRSGHRWVRDSIRCAPLAWPMGLVARVDAPGADGARTARAMGFVLVAILLLVLFFLLGSLIFVRSARRYRSAVERRRRQSSPTASADVWSMHKAPPDPESPPRSDNLSDEE